MLVLLIFFVLELVLVPRCGGSGVEVTVELACGSMSDMAIFQQ